MKVLQILENDIQDNINYLILDSRKDSLHGDIDFQWYYYNTLRFNKMKPNDIIIYRRPAKGSKERIFYFFGGGVIDYIEELDKKGNVRARIKNAFKFISPLKQGEEKLENFVWTFKTRKGDTWERFFNQYGMNVFTKDDFKNLFGDLDCVPFQVLSTSNEFQEEEEEEEEDQPISPTTDKQDFFISVVNDQISHLQSNRKVMRSKKVKVRKVDFSAQQEENMKLGKFGELKILQYEIENLLKNNRPDLAKDVEHSSYEHGDGLGYDIKSFETNGLEKFIEVKTTRKNTVDGFHISPNEIKVSKEKDNYYIYRLYNLDEKENNADLYIYSGPCDETKFKLTPTSFKVTFK